MNETTNNNNNTLSPPHTRSDNNGSGNSNINRNTNDTYVSTNQTSTPNQALSPPLNQTLRENQLSETTSLEDVAHIRVVNKNGASQKIAYDKLTPDYTSLEEQIVHGEYYLGVNGTRKQVYIRTIYGRTNNGTTTYLGLVGIDTVICAFGSIFKEENNKLSNIFPFNDYHISEQWSYFVYNGTLGFNCRSIELHNQKYLFTIKYTKR